MVYKSEEIPKSEQETISKDWSSEEDIAANFHKPSTCFLSNDRNILRKEGYKTIKQAIFKAFSEYIKALGIIDTDFYIKSSWIALTKSEGSAARHFHANSFISGVYYIDVNPLSGDLILHNDTGRPSAFPATTLLFKTIDASFHPLNGIAYRLQPKNNTIVLFPSDLSHTILPNKSHENRVSLAFDIFPCGFIHGLDESLNLDLRTNSIISDLIIKNS